MTFDPFKILDLPRRYELDPTDVERRYLTAAAKAHPDRFQSLDERREAEEQSARFNRARACLLDDEHRAEVLLTLLGGAGKSDDKSLPDGFLVEILETREQIEQVIATGDPDERKRIEQWADQQRRQYRSRTAKLFEKHARDPDGDTLGEIRIELNAWRYIQRLIEQLDESN